MNDLAKLVLLVVVASAVAGSAVVGLSYFGVVEISQSDDAYTPPPIENQNSSESVETDDLDSGIFDSTATVYTTGGRTEGLSSTGSAFQYTDKHLMTNEHVVESQDSVYVKYYEGRWSEAEVIGTDIHSDIAILRVEDVPERSEPIPMDTELPNRGETVLAIGSPNGLDDSVSTGIVSGVNRSVQIQTPFAVPDSIQTDAALNPGNSGGPLIDPDTGGVLGVNRATAGENIGYAVSARIADRIGQSLIETGDHDHSYIGIVTVQHNPLTQEDYDLPDVDGGLIVVENFDGTPGAAFQSAENGTPDLITHIDGNRIRTNEDLASYIMRETSPGDTVEFTVRRNGSEQVVSVEMASRSEAENVN